MVKAVQLSFEGFILVKLESGYWPLQQRHRKQLMIGLAIVFKQQASLFLKQQVVSFEWTLKNLTIINSSCFMLLVLYYLLVYNICLFQFYFLNTSFTYIFLINKPQVKLIFKNKRLKT